jgi:hypothetical protein
MWRRRTLTDDRGISAQLFEHAYDTTAADAEVDFDRQHVAGKVVDHVERSKRPAVDQHTSGSNG